MEKNRVFSQSLTQLIWWPGNRSACTLETMSLGTCRSIMSVIGDSQGWTQTEVFCRLCIHYYTTNTRNSFLTKGASLYITRYMTHAAYQKQFYCKINGTGEKLRPSWRVWLSV